ncbi:MAG: hypothetical protein K9I94_04915 [Bacteroidales bacterium]|nr:hypothetical protein [Bacteroidales bacterium]
MKFILNSLTYVLISTLVFTTACSDDDFGEVSVENSLIDIEEGVFIVNEGNFGQNSSSISFFSYDSLSVTNNVFFNANNRPLGDVTQSMTIIDTLGFVVVNNSGKIEVMDLDNGNSVSTISGLPSPRAIIQINRAKAYVSDFRSDSIAIIDVNNFSITGYINLGRTSECFMKFAGVVFVCNWSEFYQPDKKNDQVVVIDAVTNQVIDSIRVVKEPNSMVIDNNGKLWVLSSGGFQNDETPALQCIDPIERKIDKKFLFPDVNSSPEDLVINKSGDTLLFVNNDIYKMPVSAAALPSTPLVQANERNFKAMDVDPETSRIFTADALDYQQKGIVYEYTFQGDEVRSFRAGIIPGDFAFYHRHKE